ncbi:MAG: glycoside hydrolase family 10 protein [Dysgonomonas sp.]
MQNIFKKSTYLLFFVLFFITSCKTQQPKVHYSDLKYPKREFRGAWIHTIGQNQYKSMNPTQMKQYFTDMLDKFQSIGINAVIFQVRPQADAFYYSEIEPWSRYLTGMQGKAPDGDFDPLAFMVEECHKRNIELHAWLNPYRVTSAEGQQLAKNHIYNSRPELFVKYGSQIYFDPGIPENRQYICKVVKDIVKRYDVDAIHMDDYFYPYPIAGQNFPDDDSFLKHASSQGFKANQRSDWRRNNVNLLINELHDAIKVTKPWVRFGISPFGIYRNKKSTSDGSGSDTNGLQNYDDLYADIKLWVKNHWIDYNIPQVYWEIGHKAADYNTLVDWWAKNNYGDHLYIGQDVKRTMDATNSAGDTQLSEKYLKERSHPEITGNCFWNGYLLLENYKGISGELVNNYQKYPSLIPAYTQMHDKSPKEVKNLKEEFTPTTHILQWDKGGDPIDPENAQYYVVYRFENGERKNRDDVTKIVSITRKNNIILPYEGGKMKYEYVVTSVDRFHNESKGKSKKMKL